MEDDVTMAQLLMIASSGLQDGGSDKIDKYYKANDDEYNDGVAASAIVNDILTFFVKDIGDIIKGTKLATTPQFIVLFAALAHRLRGIPSGDVDGVMPAPNTGVGDIQAVTANLMSLAAALETEQPPAKFATFVNRSTSTTQRIASRQVRFRMLYEALGEYPI